MPLAALQTLLGSIVTLACGHQLNADVNVACNEK